MWIPEGKEEPSTWLVQRWSELFDRYSPDTFRAPVMHLTALLWELRELTQLAMDESRLESQRGFVLDELRQSPIHQRERLTKKSRLVLSKLGRADLKTELHLLESIWEELQPETQAAQHGPIADLKGLEPENFLKCKTHVDRLITELATDSLHRGFGRAYCRSLLDAHDTAKQPTDIFQLLQDGLFGDEVAWRCVFGVQDYTGKRSMTQIAPKTKFRPLARENRLNGGQEWHNFVHSAEGLALFFVDIRDRDPHNAIHIGFRDLRRIAEVLNFYHGAAPVRIHSKVFAFRPDTPTSQYLLDFEAEAVGGTKAQRNAIARAEASLDGLASIDVPSQLQNALELRNLAYSTTSTPLRFTHMWSALEALVSPRREDAVIGRVLGAVPTIVVHGRFRKIVKYLAIRLHEGRCLERLPKDLIGVHFASSSSRFVSATDLFRLLRFVEARDGKPHNAALLKVFGSVSPLDRFHLHEAWKMLSDPKKTKRAHINSYERVTWQLRRIYRARNLLVHTGRVSPLLPHLLRNLEFYLSLVITAVLHDVSSRGYSVRKSLDLRAIEYEYLIDTLDAGDLSVLETTMSA